MRSGELATPAGTQGDLGWPLRRAVALHPNAEAFIDGQRRLTYAQVGRRVAALGPALRALGLAPGAPVGFLGVNSIAHAECWLGIPAAGHVLVDLNFRLAPSELAFIADDCGIAVLIVDAHQLEVARGLRERCPTLGTLIYDGAGPCPQDCTPYEELVAGDGGGPPTGPPEPDALAAISYTGGTTGAPKGVMLSHANLLANARHNLIATGHRHEDRWLHVCPMFHVAGTANVFACTWVGARQMILPRFAADAVIGAIQGEALTHTVLVPTMLGMLLDALPAGTTEATPLPSLRHVQYAASPISPDVQRRAVQTLGCDIAQFYGMTEAAPTVTHLTPEEHRLGVAGREPHATRLRSIGVPVVGVEAEVRGSDGARLPAGEVGELWVRGPNVMLGYFNRPDATREALADGWYRSGDAVRADADGFLYLVDRLKDMIITGGENVYSVEVEHALLEHAAVQEAAVFGIPDPRWGEAVHAVISVGDGPHPTPEELIDDCRERIAGYKVPRSIEIRTEPLPKSGAGKLLKNRLRAPFWADRDRRIN